MSQAESGLALFGAWPCSSCPSLLSSPRPQNSSLSCQAKTHPSRGEAGHAAQSWALNHQAPGDLHSLAGGTLEAARPPIHQSVRPAGSRSHVPAPVRPGQEKADQRAWPGRRGERDRPEEELQPAPTFHTREGPQCGHPAGLLLRAGPHRA